MGFKVGDLVKRIKGSEEYIKINSIYTVKKVLENGNIALVLPSPPDRYFASCYFILVNNTVYEVW